MFHPSARIHWLCFLLLSSLGAATATDNVAMFANSSIAADLDHCGSFTNCSSCIVVEGCGFCVKANKCVAGGVWGPATKMSCGEGSRFDFLYSQCQVTHKFILYGLVILASLIAFVSFSIMLCCCCRSREPERQRLLQPRPYIRRSSTYYQWNRAPPSPNRRRSPHAPWQPTITSSSVIHIPPQDRVADGMGGRRFGASPNIGSSSVSGGGGLFGSSIQSGGSRLMGGGGVSSDKEEDPLQPSTWEQRRNELLKKYGRSHDST